MIDPFFGFAGFPDKMKGVYNVDEPRTRPKLQDTPVMTTGSQMIGRVVRKAGAIIRDEHPLGALKVPEQVRVAGAERRCRLIANPYDVYQRIVSQEPDSQPRR